ncbi:SPFH domain-containing protein [Pedobacter caeni]|uniref:SPFH domain / Band 7 family protein n=1 Tax=Pedobacter caeni TaxID=288992 RepID=A0A1M5B8K9_9SPHI|nr:SPFH domain-containing protein [Pedobacter caeni]SHF38891.1 SPFH domain / Band 7 family protein [Pedobacter caeni]
MSYLFIMLIVGVAIVAAGIVRVPPNSILIIERFGKFQKAVVHGTHFRIPLIEQVSGFVSTLPGIDTLKVSAATETAEVIHLTLSLDWEILNTAAETVARVFYLYRDGAKRKAMLSEFVKRKVADFFFNRSKLIVGSDYDALSIDLKLQMERYMKDMGYKLMRLQIKDLYQD